MPVFLLMVKLELVKPIRKLLFLVYVNFNCRMQGKGIDTLGSDRGLMPRVFDYLYS